MALYFQRHDGQAVTCDDFAQAIADANPQSELTARLAGFKLWYAQAGTPAVSARGNYDAAAQRYTLTLSQHSEPSPGQPQKQPFVIPVLVGLLGVDGSELAPERLLVLDSAEQSWTFDNVRCDAGARAAARVLGAGAAGRWPVGRRTRDPAGARQRPVQSLGSRPAADAGAPARALNSGAAPVLDDSLARALRSVLRDPATGPRVQGAGAGRAQRELHRRTAGKQRPPSASTTCANNGAR